jgi:hypothetical protein
MHRLLDRCIDAVALLGEFGGQQLVGVRGNQFVSATRSARGMRLESLSDRCGLDSVRDAEFA